MRRGADLTAGFSLRIRRRPIRAVSSRGDQYGNWAGGGGFTVRQGLRVGVSGYRGPYLDRKYAYYFPGEVNPGKLPAHAIGLDGNWAHGHTTAFVEVQRFVMPYTVIPDFRESAGYAEVKAGSGATLVCCWPVLAGEYQCDGTNECVRNGGRISPGQVSAAQSGIRIQTFQFERPTG